LNQSFEVGQKFLVTKRGKDHDEHGMGLNKPWCNVWPNVLDILIGTVVTVAESPEGMFEEDGIAIGESDYLLPASVLMPLNVVVETALAA
jgi:hypothetical protein